LNFGSSAKKRGDPVKSNGGKRKGGPGGGFNTVHILTVGEKIINNYLSKVREKCAPGVDPFSVGRQSRKGVGRVS